MKKIILNLGKLTGDALILFAYRIICMLTGNDYFKDSKEVVKKLEEATNEYAELKNARPISPGIVYTKNVKELKQVVKVRIKQVAFHVQSVAYDNEPELSEEIISSGGFEMKKTYIKPYVLFSVKHGTKQRSVKASMRVLKNACYLFEISTDIRKEANWKKAVISSTSKATFENLIPDTRYWVRGAYIVGQIQFDFTVPISIIVI